MRTSRWQPRRETPEPLEANDVAVFTGGTVVWLALFVCQLPFYGWFRDHGHAWWIWCCAAGAGLGGIGIVYTRRRRDAIARSRHDSVTRTDQG